MLLETEKENLDVREMEDEEILAYSITKPDAFSILVDRYQDALIRKATTIVGPENAPDLVQDAFVKIYINAHKFQKVAGASFKSWAYKILINTCFNHYKKYKKENQLKSVLDPEMLALLPEADKDHKQKIDRDEILSKLSRLPLILSNVLKLYFLEGRPHREIAEMEGVSEGAIRARVCRAKKELKKVTVSLENN